MTTYYREKPCRKCGSHDFYLASQHCAPCLKAHNAVNNVRNRDKNREYQRSWSERNREYLKLYRKARYQLRKEQAV